MKWSRIQGTELAEAAVDLIDANEDQGCSYHNGWHVKTMYEYLDATDEPYDAALDWAVLFHDIVYDDKPEKEFRSADLFLKMRHEYDGCNLDFDDKIKVVSMIYSTKTHEVTATFHSAIIRADLHALTDPIQTFRNFNLILCESKSLYGVDEITFAENNIKFMGGLYDRIERNILVDNEYREFYNKVKRGIVSTINLSRILKGDL